MRRAQVEVATIDNPRQPLRHTDALITWGDAPSDFQATGAWGLFQNWREWLEEGHLDAGIPMTYYDYDVYPSWYRNWVDQEMLWRYDRHIFVGPGIYLNSFANSLIEIEYAQNAGANGICTYSYAGTSGSGDRAQAMSGTGTYFIGSWALSGQSGASASGGGPGVR